MSLFSIADDISIEAKMYLSLRDIKKQCTLSKSTIYRLIKVGLFPEPVPLSPGRVGWREEEFEAWKASPKSFEKSGEGLK